MGISQTIIRLQRPNRSREIGPTREEAISRTDANERNNPQPANDENKDRYRPRAIYEIDDDGVSLINDRAECAPARRCSG
jgi:hypothetical protein